MERKLVIDANSIIIFFRYYCFDKYNSREIYGKLFEFIVSKIKSGEIIVIDKVFNELQESQRDTTMTTFKKQIKKEVVKTEFLLEKIETLRDRYRITYNEEKFYNDPHRLELELQNYLEKYADLYLVSYCKNLEEKGIKAILITEETTKPDKKPIEKIPTICKWKNECIEYRKMPYTLFEIYKDELKFKLEIK